MSARARVPLGLVPLDEEAIEQALYDGGELQVLGSGADAGELLALAHAGRPELVLVSAGLPGLDAASVVQLRRLGARLAGLALDERAAAQLEPLDLDLLVRAPEQAATRLLTLVAEGRNPLGAEHEAGLALEPRRRSPRTPSAREGSIIAVLGSRGAPGSSELAASFAALVCRRHRVLLAELDGEGGALALRLGVDPQAGSLLGPLRALALGEADPRALLPHWILERGRGWPAILPGLPDPRRDLAETAAPGLTGALLELLAASFPLVVCDLGHRLHHCGERDLAARLHREAALAADALVLVLGARPAQLQAGLAQLDLLLGELGVAPEALWVAVNGQPGVRSPRGAGAAAISAELASRGLSVDAWLPFDERALRASARRGRPLALAARRGGYARVLARLASAILLPSLPRPAARKRRLRALPPAPPERAARASEEVALPWKA